MNNEEQKDETPTEAAIVGNTVLAAVPYQCCPLCNGNGQTVADGLSCGAVFFRSLKLRENLF